MDETRAGPGASRHAWLILNGKAAGDESLRVAVHALRDNGLRVDVRVTWEHGDAARHVAEACAAGADTVVAAGGDGTLGAVAAALAEQGDDAHALPALAVLPLGTANDFAAAARVPETPSEALTLLQRPAVAIDLLRVEADGARHWCLNLASGGFGTTVTQETPGALKRALGGLAYAISGLARIGQVEPVHARLQGEGFGWHGRFIALGLGNGRQAGGGQALCPDACIDDGLIDLTLVPPLDGVLGDTLGTAVFEGSRAALERVATRARLRRVELIAECMPAECTPTEGMPAEATLTLNLDGEPVTAQRFVVEAVPRRLRMRLPEGCPLLAVSQ